MKTLTLAEIFNHNQIFQFIMFRSHDLLIRLHRDLVGLQFDNRFICVPSLLGIFTLGNYDLILHGCSLLDALDRRAVE